MKNGIIALLLIAVVGLGGWTVYDKTKSDDDTTATSSTGTSTTPAGSTQTKSANTLDLSSKGLTSVGPDIYNKTSTTTLILSNNNIQTLPSEMGKMTRLEVFKIDHNRLDGSLIGEIRKMPLKSLDVSYNNMTGMPAEIGQLNKLETLNYSYNKITGLPNELANLKNTLKEFNLTGNPLSQDTLNKLKAQLPNTNIIF
jgi:Leucine-rich repeat (LRR) protein